MLKKTLLACIALAIFLSCYILDKYKVDPEFQKVFRFSEVPCLAYLIYYWIVLRRQLWGPKALLRTQLLRTYLLLVGAVGFAFVIGGLLITSFAVSQIVAKGSPADKSGDWTGLWMGVFGTGLGICAIVVGIIFGRRKKGSD
jgi:hypothetical protein